MPSDLAIMIRAFNKRSDTVDPFLSKCHKVHQEFLTRWPLEQLPELLTLDSYVIGKGDTDTFCYWVERKTRLLGSILGSPAMKFKVYYSSKTHAYEYLKQFGNEQEAFKATKEAILSLLDSAGASDLSGIKKNSLLKYSTLFRGKLLYLYFPEKFLSVFSEPDIDYFMDRLGIDYDPGDHVVDKGQKLLRFKKQAPKLKKWSSGKFMVFLYDQLIPPSRSGISIEGKTSQTEKEIEKEAGKFVLPQIKDVTVEELDISDLPDPSSAPQETGRSKKKRKPNYLREQVRNTKLGTHGEEVVVAHEKAHLNQNGQPDLADKVERVSIKDDSLGYDIRSFALDGSEKFIEVKSTTTDESVNFPFFLTENERRKMENLGDCYFIYRLLNANASKPKLLKLNSGDISNGWEMEVTTWKLRFKGAS